MSLLLALVITGSEGASQGTSTALGIAAVELGTVGAASGRGAASGLSVRVIGALGAAYGSSSGNGLSGVVIGSIGSSDGSGGGSAIAGTDVTFGLAMGRCTVIGISGFDDITPWPRFLKTSRPNPGWRQRANVSSRPRGR